MGLVRFNPFFKIIRGRKMLHRGDMVRKHDLEKYVKEIEDAVDKLFLDKKIEIVKLAETPKVDVMDIKGEGDGEVKETKETTGSKKGKTPMYKEEAKRIPEGRSTSRTSTRVETGGIESTEKEEDKITTKGVELQVARKESDTKKSDYVTSLEEKIPLKRVHDERRIKPLVDLSIKGIIGKDPFYDQEEESTTKPEKKEEHDENLLEDDFTNYVFLDEAESTIKSLITLPEDKLDYGDVELPRESLKFEPMVEFKPREEELKINVPISNERLEEITFYPVNRPYAYVKILRDKKTLEKIYAVLEPELTDDETKQLQFIKDTLENFVDIDILSIDEKGAEKCIEKMINQVISDYGIPLSEDTKKKILYLIKRDTVGYGKVDVMMRDPYIEDISCDGANLPIFIYHRDYGSMRTNVGFENEEELSAFVIKLAQKCGKHISVAEPMLDATLPDGSRIQATLGTEVTTRGSTFTIRKFRADPFTPPDLIELGTMSPEMVAYFWLVVEHGISAIFAGGTASGKTTTLNAVALFIPREAKIVSIEETREINLPHPNWIPGVTRSGFGEIVADKVVGEIDMYDLLKAALRQRPEYIIVGEIRGREAYVLFQAMATGHTTYSTMHADSPQSLIHRLEGKPINIPRVMLQALDFVCFQTTTRIKDKRERRITQIVEIVDIDPVTKEIITNEVFTWDSITDTFRYSGKSYLLEKIRAKLQTTKEELMKELNNRIKIINWMIKNNILSFREVVHIINEYRDNPKELLERVEING